MAAVHISPFSGTWYPARAAESASHFLRIGLDDVCGYLDGGIDAWAVAGYPLTKLTTISVRDLAGQIRGGSKPINRSATCQAAATPMKP